MSDENLLNFINKSTYRTNILNSIGTGYKIPSEIARDCGILINHISTQLRTLQQLDLIECVNPEYTKGRLYRLTDKGLSILDKVEYDPVLGRSKRKHRFEACFENDVEKSKDSENTDDSSTKKTAKKTTKKSSKKASKSSTNQSNKKTTKKNSKSSTKKSTKSSTKKASKKSKKDSNSPSGE